MADLLIVDDDLALVRLLTDYLKDHGFTLQSTSEPSKCLDLISRLNPSLLILDVMLPETDGFSVIREIRRTRQIPILMLTARGESSDRVLGLELGADDYLTKPFEPRELVARIKSILRRSGRLAGDLIISGKFTVDSQKRLIKVCGDELDLTTSEYELLALFIQNPGRKFTRDELLSQLRGEEIEAFGRAIDNLVNRVRRKLEMSGASESIRTVWGTGYMYVEEEN